jgi:hypothetical protein
MNDLNLINWYRNSTPRERGQEIPNSYAQVLRATSDCSTERDRQVHEAIIAAADIAHDVNGKEDVMRFPDNSDYDCKTGEITPDPADDGFDYST